MRKSFYVVTRDLHLYIGLFLSPFVLVFAISVFYLVHVWGGRAAAPQGREVSNLPVSDELERLSGRDQVNSLRPLLDRLDVRGEISSIRRISKDHRLGITVVIPGRETTVDLNLQRGAATISERNTGVGRFDSSSQDAWSPQCQHTCELFLYGSLAMACRRHHVWRAVPDFQRSLSLGSVTGRATSGSVLSIRRRDFLFWTCICHLVLRSCRNGGRWTRSGSGTARATIILDCTSCFFSGYLRLRVFF
jgi:hypothetical protein